MKQHWSTFAGKGKLLKEIFIIKLFGWEIIFCKNLTKKDQPMPTKSK